MPASRTPADCPRGPAEPDRATGEYSTRYARRPPASMLVSTAFNPNGLLIRWSQVRRQPCTALQQEQDLPSIIARRSTPSPATGLANHARYGVTACYRSWTGADDVHPTRAGEAAGHRHEGCLAAPTSGRLLHY
jgi:hypothetical protein